MTQAAGDGSRPYDTDYPDAFKRLMRQGWVDAPLPVSRRPAADYHARRRAALHAEIRAYLVTLVFYSVAVLTEFGKHFAAHFRVALAGKGLLISVDVLLEFRVVGWIWLLHVRDRGQGGCVRGQHRDQKLRQQARRKGHEQRRGEP